MWHSMAVDVGAYTLFSSWWVLTTCGGMTDSGDGWLVMVGGENVVTVFGNGCESNCQTNKC